MCVLSSSALYLSLPTPYPLFFFFFFFNDTATTEIYTLSYTTLFRSSPPLLQLSEALHHVEKCGAPLGDRGDRGRSEEHTSELSHTVISYAVFCLKKKKKKKKKKYKNKTIKNRTQRKQLNET